MKRLLFFFLLFIFILILSIFALKQNPKENAQDHTAVLVSIGPDAYLVKRLLGDTHSVWEIVPPGASPHFFEPSPQDAWKYTQARVWLRRGEGFEERMKDNLSHTNPTLLVQDLREGMPLLEESHCHHHDHHHGHHPHRHAELDEKDLHTWMSLRLTIKQVKLMEKTLIEAFPQEKELIEKNASSLIKELKDLDQYILTLFKKNKPETILVSHPAFAYFCQDYEIEQLSVEQEGKDSSPAHLHHLLEELKEKEASKVLLQQQYNNKGAEILAEKLSLPKKYVDPYSKDYMQMIQSLAEFLSHPEHKTEG